MPDPESTTCSCCSRRKFLGATLAALFPAVSAFAEKVHMVRKGETLSGLARHYKVPLAELAVANGLTTTTNIKIGQRLKVPLKPTVPAPGAKRPQLASDLKKEFDRTKIENGRWKHVVVHHTATAVGTFKGIDRDHRQRRHMENGIAYHFLIGNGKGMKDGEIKASRRWREQLQGGHLASEELNMISLGICLVGNFETGQPSSRQLQSLASLINYLLPRCRLGRSAVKTHQQINTVFTVCPGRKFPMMDLLGMIA